MKPIQTHQLQQITGQLPSTHNLLAISHLAALHQHGLTAGEACFEAGQIIAEAFHKVSSADSLKAKGIGDFVTEVDLHSNQTIIQILDKATPKISIISEEDEQQNFISKGHSWIVDPLDGTSAFHFKTNPKHPAVMIALQNNLQTEMAIVYLPISEEWFFAVHGRGSFYYSNNQCIDLKTNQTPVDLKTTWVALNHYGDCSYETEFFSNLRSNLRTSAGAGLVTVEPPHSSIGCRLLLENGPAVVVHDNNPAKVKQEIWDIAPIKLIVECAGGVMLNTNGQDYQLGSVSPIIIARNKSQAEKIIELGKQTPFIIKTIKEDFSQDSIIY